MSRKWKQQRTAKIKNQDDRKPINHEGSKVRKARTEEAIMNPSTPKTEPPPSTQLRKVVFGGSPLSVKNERRLRGDGALKVSPIRKTARCAVIGVGWWATTAHIPALKKHPAAELVAIQSRDAGKARRIARHFEVTNACTTMEEVLAIGGLDGVIISSTPNVHFAQAHAALRQGLHVLLEKPMT